MKRYPVKKDHKVLTKKRGMVSNYVTVDDLGSESLLKGLLEMRFISDPEPKDFPPAEKKVAKKYESKNPGRV